MIMIVMKKTNKNINEKIEEVFKQEEEGLNNYITVSNKLIKKDYIKVGKNDVYYRIRNTIKHGYLINIILSERGCGKTYSAIEFMFEEILKEIIKGKEAQDLPHFVWIRAKLTHLHGQAFKDNFKLRNYPHLKEFEKEFKFRVTNQGVYYEKERLIAFLALSLSTTFKSQKLEFNIHSIFYDEILNIDTYDPNLGLNHIVQLINTITRDKAIPCYFFGNNVHNNYDILKNIKSKFEKGYYIVEEIETKIYRDYSLYLRFKSQIYLEFFAPSKELIKIKQNKVNSANQVAGLFPRIFNEWYGGEGMNYRYLISNNFDIETTFEPFLNLKLDNKSFILWKRNEKYIIQEGFCSKIYNKKVCLTYLDATINGIKFKKNKVIKLFKFFNKLLRKQKIGFTESQTRDLFQMYISKILHNDIPIDNKDTINFKWI